MTVTRRVLTAPPAPVADPSEDTPAPSAGPLTAEDRRLARERVRVLGFYAGWSGAARSVAHAAVACGLPVGQVQAHVDVLTGHGMLQAAGLQPTRFGVVEVWRWCVHAQADQRDGQEGAPA
jgi:hypothetical protein